MRSLWAAVALFVLLAAGQVQAATTRTADDFIAAMTEQLAVDPAGASARADAEIERLRRSATARTDGRLASAYWVSAQSRFRLGNNVAARQALASAQQNLPIGRAGRRIRGYIRLLTGLMLRSENDTGGALQKFRDAQTDFIESREDRGHALALQSVGILYNDAGDGNNAIRYLTLAGETYVGDDVFNLSRNINLGVAYLAIDRNSEAIPYFEAANQSADRLGMEVFEQQIALNIATADLRINELAEAKQVLATLGPLSDLADDERQWALQILAGIALKENRLSEARRMIDMALRGIAIDDDRSSLWKLRSTAYEVYLAQGEKDAALQQLEAVRRIELADAADIASTRAALLAAQFQSDAQTTRIAQLKAATLEREVQFQRTVTLMLVIGGLVVMSLLGGLLITAIRARNRARADSAELAVVNQQLERALAAKTEFLATTSHELRTPLNGILGMAQIMLADGGLPGRLRTQIELVHDAGSTMRALVDDILDVAKIEHGGFVITPRPTDVVALIGRVTRLFEEQAAGRGLTLVCDAQLPVATAMIDGDRLTQIVFNLVGNALKFTQSGRIDLSLSIESVDGEDVLQLKVADTGIGIAPEWQGAVFDMFRQVDNTRTRNYGGTGLGLAICRQLARAMGGDIALASIEGEGSCFTVSLPWQPVEPAALATLPVAHRAATDDPASGVTEHGFAVIANDPMRGAMLAAIVRREGFSADLVDSDDAIAAAIACNSLTLLVDRAAWERISMVDGWGEAAVARTILVGASSGETVMAGEGGSRPNEVAFSRNAIAAAVVARAQVFDKKHISCLHILPLAANAADEMGPEHKRVAPMSRI